ncbi:MAG: hypothetical protein RLZZ387_174 [Chloroflexota bacterium]
MPAPDPLATTRLTDPQRHASTPPPCGAGPGDLLAGRYQVGTVIGWGGQAVILHAVDTHPRGRRGPLALKVVRADLSPGARREAADLLRWEASLLRRLRHPALPRLSHAQASGADAWLVRELVDGAPLTTALRHGPADPRRVREWAAQLCTLLRYLHTRTPPVICGDLKPANLILRPDGTLALIDLGAAHTRTRRPPRKTRPRYGTPGYAPPEQLGGRALDERSDLFSLAATCYELLTGLDPALAPLVFDYSRLAAASPPLAAALRPALDPDPARRPPTAAALHASLARIPAPPLALAPGLIMASPRDLAVAAAHSPRELTAALESGAVEAWLADHPDPALGNLLHSLRATRQSSPRAAALDALLGAMAPPGGSALLHPAPRRISFGDVPLRSTRAWGAPHRLTIRNAAADPLRWELECPAQPGADVRVLAGGRALKKTGGLLPPGGATDLELVAAGVAGPRGGELTLRCGGFETAIPWDATVQPGLPVGHRVAATLVDIDPAQPGLVTTLEALARRGALQRWLRPQRLTASADQIDAALTAGDPLALRLIVGALLSDLGPARFPHLTLTPPSDALTLVAGSRDHLALTLENQGRAPCTLRVGPGTRWAGCALSAAVLLPGARCEVTVTLTPPAGLSPGRHTAHIMLRAGDLDLPIPLPVDIVAPSWWRRALQWLTG